jgi:hypothetical protein
MKKPSSHSAAGNVLLICLGTIVILSAIGANVLGNLTTRYNVTNTQVRGWKQAQHAAEAAGDIAYAEVRKTVLDPTNAFAGWTVDGATYTSPVTTFGEDNLVASSIVDHFYNDPVTGNAWYRIRAQGTAPLRGLKRVGMDDRMGPNTRGDSLLRKIDFHYDHFIAAYGPKGDGVGKALVPVASPQITRRIELITAPITPFEAAIKCQGTFYGLGNAARIDSYDSTYGPYYFCANDKEDPRYADSRAGSVQIGTAVAEVRGMLYGNLATNGGTIVRSEYVTGTIDNNVPFSLPPYKMPPPCGPGVISSCMPTPQPSPTSINGTTNLTPPAAGSPSQPIYYLLSSFGTDAKLTVNRHNNMPTYVALRVTNDVRGSITVEPGVHLQVFFDGNLDVKGIDIVNKTGYSGNLQFYAISPTNSTTQQQITIAPPGNFSAVIYAPSANYIMNGNPDVTGAAVVKTFYGNGNTMWHYDRALDHIGEAVDYRVASYVEDTR